MGNSSADLQRNPLCAWYPGTLDEGVVKTFTCARPLVGQYVAIQLVGVEGSLSLCEVETFTNDEFSVDRCLSPKIGVDTVVTTFSKTCYDFHITKGESFDKAQAICKQTGELVVHPPLYAGMSDVRGTDEFLNNHRWRLGTRLSWRHQFVHLVRAGTPEERTETAACVDWRPKGAGHYIAHLEMGER